MIWDKFARNVSLQILFNVLGVHFILYV